MSDKTDQTPPEAGLTKVTLNLTPRSVAAVQRLRANGATMTDAVNRAVQLASLLDTYTDPQTGGLTLLSPDGERIHVHLVG